MQFFSKLCSEAAVPLLPILIIHCRFSFSHQIVRQIFFSHQIACQIFFLTPNCFPDFHFHTKLFARSIPFSFFAGECKLISGPQWLLVPKTILSQAKQRAGESLRKLSFNSCHCTGTDAGTGSQGKQRTGGSLRKQSFEQLYWYKVLQCATIVPAPLCTFVQSFLRANREREAL